MTRYQIRLLAEAAAGQTDAQLASLIIEAAVTPKLLLALLDVVDAARLGRNFLLYENADLTVKGDWQCVPRTDFDALRSAIDALDQAMDVTA